MLAAALYGKGRTQNIPWHTSAMAVGHWDLSCELPTLDSGNTPMEKILTDAARFAMDGRYDQAFTVFENHRGEFPLSHLLDLATAQLNTGAGDDAGVLLQRVAACLDEPSAPRLTMLAFERAYNEGLRTTRALDLRSQSLLCIDPIEADPAFVDLRDDPHFNHWFERIRTDNVRQLGQLKVWKVLKIISRAFAAAAIALPSLSAPVSVLALPSPFLPWPSQCTLAVFSFLEGSWWFGNATSPPSLVGRGRQDEKARVLRLYATARRMRVAGRTIRKSKGRWTSYERPIVSPSPPTHNLASPCRKYELSVLPAASNRLSSRLATVSGNRTTDCSRRRSR